MGHECSIVKKKGKLCFFYVDTGIVGIKNYGEFDMIDLRSCVKTFNH